MFYYLYEIKNLINDKVYVGVHKTKSLDDGYMGSGKVIRNAIKKYGTEYFSKTILETFESSEAMFSREKEVVNDEFLARSDVYNLRRGGFGGFSDSERVAAHKILSKRTTDEVSKMNKDRHRRYGPSYSEKWSSAGRCAAFLESAKEKRKKTFLEISHQQGTTNSQFGKMWITNGSESKSIKNTDPMPDGWERGRKIK